ncbi:hypothetical protein Tco_0129108 [Tanacetum coccineum]
MHSRAMAHRLNQFSKATKFQAQRISRGLDVILGTSVDSVCPLRYVLPVGFHFFFVFLHEGNRRTIRCSSHSKPTPPPICSVASVSDYRGRRTIISGLSVFSPPVSELLVPMLYYRLGRISCYIGHWVHDFDVAWFWFGRVLAVVNLAYFSINLFGFLIPRFLPKAFDQYFREKNEIQTKKREDIQFTTVDRTQSPTDKKSD